MSKTLTRKAAAKPYKSRSYYNYKRQNMKYYNQYQKRKEAREEAAARRERTKEPGVISSMGSELGSIAGSAIPIVGGPIGRFLGGKLGHLVEKVTGFGDYKVEQNSIMRGGMTQMQIVNSVDKGSVIIRNREYIGDITSTIGFVNRQYTINPGMAETFPWLAQIANSFEQYRLRGVLFEFNSTSADAVYNAGSSTALGSVIMMTDYDVADPAPSTKREMLNTLFASSRRPADSFIHPIECKKNLSTLNVLYTRNQAVPDGFDARMYDFGTFNIATEGMQSNVGVIGELWVTYEIELMKQQNSTGGSIADHIYFTTVSTVRPLGTPTTVDGNMKRGATLGGTILANGATYQFPPETIGGQYLVSYSVTGSNTAGVIPASIDTLVNCQLVNAFANGVTNFVAAPNPAATASCCLRCVVIRVNASVASFTFNTGNGVVPGAPNGDLYVVRLPDNMVYLTPP